MPRGYANGLANRHPSYILYIILSFSPSERCQKQGHFFLTKLELDSTIMSQFDANTTSDEVCTAFSERIKGKTSKGLIVNSRRQLAYTN